MSGGTNPAKALLVTFVVSSVFLGAGYGVDNKASGAVAPAPTTAPSAPDSKTGLSVDRAIGQMLMSHVSGLVASRRLLARIRAGQVGSVILYSETSRASTS
jgi:hypothetical protein